MADPGASVVTVTTEDGVVRASIVAPSVEEREAAALLEAVRGALRRAGHDLRCVVLDFGGVSFINSTGLAACIELRNGAQAKGAPTIIYGANAAVAGLFRMVRVDRLYTFANSARELDEMITRGGPS